METQALNAWPVLQYGSNGTDVKALQYLLNAHGTALTIDGDFGTATLNAVKSFQARNGLTADGSVGSLTWPKLIQSVSYGDTGSAVKAVQMYLGLTIDGSFGTDTLNAVKAFQSRTGVGVSGVVGPQTWQALIAGGTVNPTPLPTPAPSTERDAILARGKKWVDINVPYNQKGSYDGWRTDCSGFVSMAWNLRNSSGGKISATTATLWNYAYEFKDINALLPGDAVNSNEPGGPTGTANHVVLFVKWVDKANHIFLAYEENGTGTGTIAKTRQLVRSGTVWNMKGSSRTSWHFLRRNGL